MVRRSTRVGLGICLLLLGGCTYFDYWRRAFSAEAATASTHRYEDGGEALYFVIDKSLRAERQRHPETFVFVISGSGCTSVKFWLPQYFDGLEGESGALRIFVIHKRFIGERTLDSVGGCDEAFVRADHPRRWIADYVEFIGSMLRDDRPRRVVLVGISEGAEVVPLLAERIPGVTHLVLLANGGLDPLETYALQARRFALDGSAEIIARASAPPPPDPDAPRSTLGGRSWRYWSELRELQPARRLLATDIPVVVAIGAQDQAIPVEAALRLRERFEQSGKGNLTVWIFEGADHALYVPSLRRSMLPDFWRRLDRWLAQ